MQVLCWENADVAFCLRLGSLGLRHVGLIEQLHVRTYLVARRHCRSIV